MERGFVWGVQCGVRCVSIQASFRCPRLCPPSTGMCMYAVTHIHVSAGGPDEPVQEAIDTFANFTTFLRCIERKGLARERSAPSDCWNCTLGLCRCRPVFNNTWH